jgi:transposase-like protein
MRQTIGTRKSPGEKIVKDIKRATRKQYSSEEKIRIVLDGLRCEDCIAEQTYCRWRKQYGGMGSEQLKEFKRFRKENELA